LAEPHSRVVNVSSKAHYQAKGVDFTVLRRPGKGLGAFNAYAVSKLANILHAKQLAKLYGARGLHAYSLHPGVIKSDVWREIPQPIRWLMTRNMISNEAGAKTTLYCAASPAVAAQNGLYYDECSEKEPSPAALDGALAAELWQKSHDFVA
jgi:NAD(P)-dependent dehydrogenase (short-subunit alcohol dehydrogenase family)